MNTSSLVPAFRPLEPDAAGVLSWVHIGDLHMTLDGEQNHHDLRAITAEIDACFAGSASFVFLPGDIADDGSHSAYAVVRSTLDGLQVPWCAIVGDHDVHEKSFTDFISMMSEDTQYAFTVGKVRFIATWCSLLVLSYERSRRDEPESLAPTLRNTASASRKRR